MNYYFLFHYFSEENIYGKGSHFYKNVNDVLKRCPKTSDGKKYLIENFVIVGQFCNGKVDLVETPDNCDAAVDDYNNPSIIVVFKDYQAYPAYVIEFEEI